MCLFIVITGWGSHSEDFPIPYLTAAASIGINEKDIDLFIRRLLKTFSKLVSGDTNKESAV